MSLLLNKECRLLFAKRLNLTYCVSFQNIELIGAEFRQLHERKLRLEEKLEHTMRHKETLSHQMAERAQASDNVSQIK